MFVLNMFWVVGILNIALCNDSIVILLYLVVSNGLLF